MLVNIWSSSSKILIIEVNFKQIKVLDHFLDHQELNGKTECSINIIVRPQIFKELNMVLLILLMTLREYSVQLVMVHHTFY
jgi:hypothetical protein